MHPEVHSATVSTAARRSTAEVGGSNRLQSESGSPTSSGSVSLRDLLVVRPGTDFTDGKKMIDRVGCAAAKAVERSRDAEHDRAMHGRTVRALIVLATLSGLLRRRRDEPPSPLAVLYDLGGGAVSIQAGM